MHIFSEDHYPPLPGVDIYSVDPNDEHGFEAAVSGLRASVGFPSDQPVGDLLTLATQDDRLIGFTSTYLNRPLNAIWIMEVAVSESKRGKHLGAALLHAAFTEPMYGAADHVGVHSDKLAVGFYQKLGFDQQTRRDFLTPLPDALQSIELRLAA